jgi:hypothetical protein
MMGQAGPASGAGSSGTREPGLLFYLSGEHGFDADVAGGKAKPNFLADVKILPGGSKGNYFECADNELWSYWAAGNVYAQRGTLAFDWRSREPLTETEFPIFRVGYGDHSSWDETWLRIDWNGHGFDAFVTDVNLGRTRVSYKLPAALKADEWVHLAFAWDENTGVRLYVNGKLAGEKAATGLFDATLDQFGPHSRIIAPTGVESSYNYDRGGDIDEIRIYDRALGDEAVAALARDEAPAVQGGARAAFANAKVQQEWWHRYGWNRSGVSGADAPMTLDANAVTVRRVVIPAAYDHKRLFYRATDGIRETTWPNVYNRSRIVGRFDYFQLPDWDTYEAAGKTITFDMPQERWNHLEMEGGAFGELTEVGWDKENGKETEKTVSERPKGQERTFNDFADYQTGGKLRFTNVEQETPIGELWAYYVHPGREPVGVATLSYRLSGMAAADNPSLKPLTEYIDGRYPADERMTMVAVPPGGPVTRRKAAQTGLPVVHLLIPADFREVQAEVGHGYSYTWENMDGGLDGIAIDLPALKMKATHGDVIPLNIQVKDPLWPMRDMLDYSFSVRPGEPHTLWLDLRDRILPNGKSLWITIASASPEFGPEALEGANLRLVFKPWKDASVEHVADRLMEVRENFANMVEENVNSKKLNTFLRFDLDAGDLFRVDPENLLGRQYWHDVNKEQAKPEFTPPAIPAGTPAWAYLQSTELGYLKYLIEWYIDNRQLASGEFGGGLSDDSDWLNWWPGTAAMGIDPDKLKESDLRALEMMYRTHMFTNGLATAQYDELHSYEDGINVLGQAMLLDFGSPKEIERAMETAKRLEWVTGVNAAGHRHIRTSYYSGTKMAEDGVWGWSKPNSYFVMQPALSLVLFNGSPETKKMCLELADGLLAHRTQGPDGKWTIPATIEFKTDKALPGKYPWFILWAAYRWTGDEKYIQPFVDDGPSSLQAINANALDLMNKRGTWGKQIVASVSSTQRDTKPGVQTQPNETVEHLAWQMTGDKEYLEKLYNTQIENAADRQFINTEGSLWIDRIYFNTGELQRARLGGVELLRGYVYRGDAVSWRFEKPANAQSVAILIPNATPTHMTVTLYNLDSVPVKAQMTGWEIDPGRWEITQGLEGSADKTTRMETFERSRSLDFTLPPHATTTLELTLKEKGTPYWSRPDLGIGDEDVVVSGGRVKVTVHSLGSVDAPASKVVVRDRGGKVIATAKVAALKAPNDLLPKTATVSLTAAEGELKGGSVTVEADGDVQEITQLNNVVRLDGVTGKALPR